MDSPVTICGFQTCGSSEPTSVATSGEHKGALMRSPVSLLSLQLLTLQSQGSGSIPDISQSGLDCSDDEWDDDDDLLDGPGVAQPGLIMQAAATMQAPGAFPSVPTAPMAVPNGTFWLRSEAAVNELKALHYERFQRRVRYEQEQAYREQAARAQQTALAQQQAMAYQAHAPHYA